MGSFLEGVCKISRAELGARLDRGFSRETGRYPAVIDWLSLAPAICFVKCENRNSPSSTPHLTVYVTLGTFFVIILLP